MSPPVIIDVRVQDGQPRLAQVPEAAGVRAEAQLEGRWLRVRLRGDGEVEVRFQSVRVRDVDVRGGYACTVPGSPFVVRAPVDGWLSISARLEQ